MLDFCPSFLNLILQRWRFRTNFRKIYIYLNKLMNLFNTFFNPDILDNGLVLFALLSGATILIVNSVHNHLSSSGNWTPRIFEFTHDQLRQIQNFNTQEVQTSQQLVDIGSQTSNNLVEKSIQTSQQLVDIGSQTSNNLVEKGLQTSQQLVDQGIQANPVLSINTENLTSSILMSVDTSSTTESSYKSVHALIERLDFGIQTEAVQLVNQAVQSELDNLLDYIKISPSGNTGVEAVSPATTILPIPSVDILPVPPIDVAIVGNPDITISTVEKGVQTINNPLYGKDWNTIIEYINNRPSFYFDSPELVNNGWIIPDPTLLNMISNSETLNFINFFT